MKSRWLDIFVSLWTKMESRSVNSPKKNSMANIHSHPQRLLSFWSAPGIATSGLVQHQKSVIHRLSIKSDESDWPKIRNEYSVHAQKIRFGKRSRFLVLIKRRAAAGDENGKSQTEILPYWPSGKAEVWDFPVKTERSRLISSYYYYYLGQWAPVLFSYL